jgi:molecular chaperone HtpG
MLEMQFDFDGLIEVIAKNLYSEKKVFIRELIQNGHDGIQRRAHGNAGWGGRIDIETRPQDLEITIRDNGTGMSRADLIDYLSNVGKSYTRQQRESTEGLIGQFGIGFLSAFVVAKRVEVRTRKIGEEQGWLWTNDGKKTYELTECAVDSPGTSVRVILRDPEDRGIIQETEVRDLIRKYADMLNVPIYLNGGGDPENTMRMPWEKPGLTPLELELELHFYLERTMTDSVLEVIPVKLTEPVRAEGVLYISRTRSISVNQRRTMRIYQDRMLLCDDGDDLLPEWARFVNGVLNTPDLTPTAARDNFIRNAVADQLRQALGDAIIQHLDQLRSDDPERFTDIIRFHRVGFLAACRYYEDFFTRFAHMLLWRTNDLSTREHASPVRYGRTEVLRTLPDIIADIPTEPGEPVQLPCFTTPSTASQYFEVANAAGRVVVDASFLYEPELLEAYTRLPNVNVVLSHVDREDHPDLFGEPSPDHDGDVLRLAETMSLLLRTPGGGNILTEARRFEPPSIVAVVRSDELSRAQQKAEEIRLDPNASQSAREVADALAEMTAQQARRLTINAGNPLIRRLARQNLTDPEVQKLMSGIYNNAVLANRELITPDAANIFHHQFQELMDRCLDYLETRQELDQALSRAAEQEARRRAALKVQTHRIFFMMTPFADQYQPLIAACRQMIEVTWKSQLIVASDWQENPQLLENVVQLMSQAHAFIAEVTDGNPNVMFELGAAFADQHHRPFALLRQRGIIPLPVDLRGMLYIDYDIGRPDLEKHLNGELRKNKDIRALLDADSWENYVSADHLAELSPVRISDHAIYERLAAEFPTAEAWDKAEESTVAKILGGKYAMFAGGMLEHIRQQTRI